MCHLAASPETDHTLCTQKTMIKTGHDEKR